MKKIADNINTAVKPTRNSNIELLRVVSMLMIVAYHYAAFGFFAEDLAYSPNKYFVDIFGMGGKIGTDLFVLISGYYMVNSRFTLKKLLAIMGQLWFYTIGSLFVFVLLYGADAVDSYVLKISVFPLLFSHYWFASYYVLLMLLSPFLNKLIACLNRAEHAILAVLLFMICCFLPEFAHISFADGSLPLFVCLYVCAAYCRLHIPHEEKIAKRGLLLALAVLALCITRIIVSINLGQSTSDTGMLMRTTDFMGAYSPFAFVVAFLLLVAGCCRKAKSSPAVTVLGGLMFGVYLCHSNQLTGSVIWQDIFKTATYANSPGLVIHAVVAVTLVFVTTSFLDYVRSKTFAPVWDKICNRLILLTEKFLHYLKEDRQWQLK